MPVVWIRTISMTPFFQGVGHLGVARTLIFTGGVLVVVVMVFWVLRICDLRTYI